MQVCVRFCPRLLLLSLCSLLTAAQAPTDASVQRLQQGPFTVCTTPSRLHLRFAPTPEAAMVLELVRLGAGPQQGRAAPTFAWALKIEDSQGYRLLSQNVHLVGGAAWGPGRLRLEGQPDNIAQARRQMLSEVGTLAAPAGYAAEWGYLQGSVFPAMRRADADLDRLNRAVRQGKRYPLVSDPSLQPLPRPLVSGSDGGSLKELEVGRRIYPGFVFKQVVELWSQPWKAQTQHSATWTKTYARRKCAAGARLPACTTYTLIGEIPAKNHGAAPGQEQMALYDICEPEVELDGWFQAGNECAGFWGVDHTCNDDTAGQINNAFGVWTGHTCRGQRRRLAPACRRHW